jgi:hypothetical protein
LKNDFLNLQLMLKRVLLAYARWNKSIGYCQGFNMLAALILEVMDKQESESLQVNPDLLYTGSIKPDLLGKLDQ